MTRRFVVTDLSGIGDAERAAKEAALAQSSGDISGAEYASLAHDLREAERHIYKRGELARIVHRFRTECHPDRQMDVEAFWKWAERIGIANEAENILDCKGYRVAEPRSLQVMQTRTEQALRRLDIEADLAEYDAYLARREVATEREWADFHAFMATHRVELEAIIALPPEQLSNEQRVLLRKHGPSLRITKELEEIEALPEVQRNEDQRRKLRLMGPYFLPKRQV